MTFNCDKEDLVTEIKGKSIVHWNYRGLATLPEAIRSSSEYVREIYLKENKLTDLPNWINELVNVTHLYLHGNNLKRFPSELATMPNLKVLDLGENGLDALLPCIGELLSLESLILDNNSLQRLPTELRRVKNLRSISICNNEFVVLPEWIGSFLKLEQLLADDNLLRELPNRLTIAPSLRVVSVTSNRLYNSCQLVHLRTLSYLPLNGFVSSPSIYFNGNPRLNYLSYPIYRQLIADLGNREILLQKWLNSKIYERSKNSKTCISTTEVEDTMIDIPRQLLKIHNVGSRKPVSLWELSLRKIYQLERDISETERDSSSLGVLYDLLRNGPIAVCVNENCRKIIFTEAWLITAMTPRQDSISKCLTIVALSCSQNCALQFAFVSEEFDALHWHLDRQ